MTLDFTTPILGTNLKPIHVDNENRGLTVGDCFLALLCGGQSKDVKKSMDKWSLARSIRKSTDAEVGAELTQSQMLLLTEAIKENHHGYADLVVAQLGEFINF